MAAEPSRPVRDTSPPDHTSRCRGTTIRPPGTVCAAHAPGTRSTEHVASTRSYGAPRAHPTVRVAEVAGYGDGLLRLRAAVAAANAVSRGERM